MGAKKLTSTRIDARQKIIQKKRVQIRDAREVIAENARKSIKDARELLSTKKSVAPRQAKKAAVVRTARAGRKTASKSFEHIDEDFDEMEYICEQVMDLKPIGNFKRTVKNDMFVAAPPVTMPKLPQFSISHELSRASPDPFECYNVNPRRIIPNPPMRPERADSRYKPGRVMSAHMDAYEPRKSILRSASSDDHDDRFVKDQYYYSPGTIRARLYDDHSRDRSESAGIFAKLPVRGTSPSTFSESGYRIVVSNLHTSVTESDVRELFEDIGPLGSVKLVRPGVAEVVFKIQKDAEEAVDTYHNRQLDGQPMKCMLVRLTSKSVNYKRI